MTLFDAGAVGVRRLTLVRLSSEIARAFGTIGRIAVEGEVHRPRRTAGGRIYFVLRDRAAQITVACPAGRAARCRAVDGERVQVTGSLQWANDRGQAQLMAEEVVPVGEGAVAALIAETRARLAADGLLTRPRRPVPRLPRLIGVVCGAEAAVRKDIESVAAARFPGYPVEFLECAVSGPGAADAIVRSLQAFDARADVDVIVLARGGGDAVQLLPFSDELLCRAVAACSTPVVSAIGHDGDRPLCDEVADLRCGTPSIAAAAVIPDRALLLDQLDTLLAAAGTAWDRRAERAAQRLRAIDVGAALRGGADVAERRLERATARLRLADPRRDLAAGAARLGALRRELDALDPRRVLERGYAVVRTADGRVLRSAGQVAAGAAIDVELAVGRLAATVDRVEEARQ